MPNAQYYIDEARRLKNSWSARNKRMQEWLKLEALVDENKQTDTMSYVTNDPQVMLSMAVHLLTAQPIRHQVVSPLGSEGKKSSETEKALISVWRQVDEEFSASGQGASWFSACAYWMCLLGWYALSARVEKDEKNQPLFIADQMNPMDVYPQYTSHNLQSVAHFYRTTLADVREKAELWGSQVPANEDESKSITVVNYWWKPSIRTPAHNVVVAEGSETGAFVLKPPMETKLYRIPVMVGPVGGLPLRGIFDEVGDTSWQADAGRSILEPNRQTIKQLNMWMSALSEIARQASATPVVATGVELTAQQLKRPLRGGRAILSTKNKDARIATMDPGRFPLELQAVLGVLDGEKQRGGFPYVLYGGLTTDLSGFAINQLLSAATKLVGSQKQALSKLVSSIDKVWLEEYRTGDFEPIQIAGKDADNKWFMDKFEASRIPDKLFIETEVKLDLPSDLMQRVTILRQALGNNLPFMDVLTGLDQIVKMEDPYSIMERIKQDQASFSQEAQQIRVWQGIKANAEELRKVGGRENLQAAEMLDQLAAYMVSQFSTMTQARAGAQPRTQGLPPEMMPPEASGRSPDLMRQLLGLPPAGANVGGR